MNTKIFYYVDGSCKANGNPKSIGGFGVVKLDENDHILWEYQDTKTQTTNNEMELMAILTALKQIKENKEYTSFFKPIIYSDSSYCVNLINNWMYTWERNGWKRPKNQEVKNLNIIKQIYKLAHLAEIKKVPGHVGIFGNEIADELATGKRKANLYLDYKPVDFFEKI